MPKRCMYVHFVQLDICKVLEYGLLKDQMVTLQYCCIYWTLQHYWQQWSNEHSYICRPDSRLYVTYKILDYILQMQTGGITLSSIRIRVWPWEHQHGWESFTCSRIMGTCLKPVFHLQYNSYACLQWFNKSITWEIKRYFSVQCPYKWWLFCVCCRPGKQLLPKKTQVQILAFGVWVGCWMTPCDSRTLINLFCCHPWDK